MNRIFSRPIRAARFAWTTTMVILIFSGTMTAQRVHPHILVRPEDKPVILKKISEQDWARLVYDEMRKEITPYVVRHRTDPEWILSRYLMNRIPGKRYTQFISDAEGTALTGYAGDAPFPTVRVAPHKRPPISADGYGYKMPAIEELLPYDTSMTMMMQSTAPGGRMERVDPQTYVDNINGGINELALQASVIYWLSGDESYARFAADILVQWARGAYHQSPITGPCRTGFLSIQTLGDGSYEAMPLIHDFLYDYLRKNKYETKWFEPVFDKMAHTMTFRGFWNNNWFAAQSIMMVFSALALEDESRRDFYLDFYLSKDTISGACGHLALPSVVSKWLTPDGHWKEPGGYHNFPVGNLLLSAVAMEKNGHDVFRRFPELFKASHVMLKYAFPNLMNPTFGDTGPSSQSPGSLEIGMAMAEKYHDTSARQLASVLQVLIDNKRYERRSAGLYGLLTHLPELPKADTNGYAWPRSGELDFAKAYLQRNGTDKQSGLMYIVQGGTYNHNHANGMSVELYGAGMIMGPDPGNGPTYEAPLHVQYYTQWAAHNTVTAGGVSSPIPVFKGGGGTKQIGAISLKAMEPMAGKDAVSPNHSFTDTRYKDKATGALQQRTLAIIRTSPTTGYYADIYRSAHPGSNEYVYHNIGNAFQWLDSARMPLRSVPTDFPLSKKPIDPPGFRFIKNMQSIGRSDRGVIASFSIRGDDAAEKNMQVHFAAAKGRTYYDGLAPEAKTTDPAYRKWKIPTIIARQEGEAWKRPFVAVYEPFTGEGKHTIEEISVLELSDPGDFTVLQVRHRDNGKELIFQSVDGTRSYQKGAWRFTGRFGVVGLKGDQPEYMYIGSGSALAYGTWSIQIPSGEGAAELRFSNGHVHISCNQETSIAMDGKKPGSVRLLKNGVGIPLAMQQTISGVRFSVPAVSDALLIIE